MCCKHLDCLKKIISYNKTSEPVYIFCPNQDCNNISAKMLYTRQSRDGKYTLNHGTQWQMWQLMQQWSIPMSLAICRWHRKSRGIEITSQLNLVSSQFEQIRDENSVFIETNTSGISNETQNVADSPPLCFLEIRLDFND